VGAAALWFEDEFVKLIEAENHEDLSRKARDVVVRLLRTKPASLITLATGNTPVPMFRKLAAVARTNPQLFRQARFVTLDEYADIRSSDRRRLLSWLNREFTSRAGIDPQRIIAFNPAADHLIECARIEDAIAQYGGLDLAVLGLGPNGHIGFNEPGSSFAGRTRKVTLAGESIRSNAAYWGSEADVPPSGLTLGIGTLCEARSILLLASGDSKAEIVARLIHDPVGEALPASVLRLCANAFLLADRAALSKVDKPGEVESASDALGCYKVDALMKF
jgi:glucosamine-6-phosphate deaminase